MSKAAGGNAEGPNENANSRCLICQSYVDHMLCFWHFIKKQQVSGWMIWEILEVHDQFTVLQVGSSFCDMICEMICLFVLVSDQMTRMFVPTSLPNLPIRLSH